MNNGLRLKMREGGFWLYAVVRDRVGIEHEIAVSGVTHENALILMSCGIRVADNDASGQFLVSLLDGSQHDGTIVS